jgi:hypothetical protein
VRPLKADWICGVAGVSVVRALVGAPQSDLEHPEEVVHHHHAVIGSPSRRDGLLKLCSNTPQVVPDRYVLATIIVERRPDLSAVAVEAHITVVGCLRLHRLDWYILQCFQLNRSCGWLGADPNRATADIDRCELIRELGY